MSATPAAIENVLQILEGLKKTTEGTILHGFITRGLRKFGDTRIEIAFMAFADRLLSRYLDNPDADPSTRVRVKLTQSRLRPYLEELNAALESTAAEAAAAGQAGVVTPPPAVDTQRPTTPRSHFAATLKPTPERTPITVTSTPVLEPAPAPSPPSAEPVATAIESVPEQLARQMADTLTHDRDLDEVLRTSLAALSGPGADVTALRQQLAQGIEELIAEHRQLERELQGQRRQLATMDVDRRQLAQALDQARKHSLTDELTGLPNRSAFLRQLNAEIGRARRYGFSLALALIDIDQLQAINNTHGEAAGDAVLHTYATEIMGQFRGYDLVARYGEDEFAVLLPNTQKDGAHRAIEKAQKRAAETVIQVNGHGLPLPSFSSVLTLYSHGEAPEALLQRADEALAHARRRGPAQTLVALPPA